MQSPLVIPCLSVIAGILIHNAAGTSLFETLSAAFAFLLLSGICRLVRSPGLVRASFMLAIVAAAAAYSSLRSRPDAPLLDASPGDTVLLSGCVVDPAVTAGDRVRFTLELAPGARVRVGAQPGPASGLAYGTILEVPARVQPVSGFLNPGSFDAREWFARRDIFWTASVPHDASWQASPSSCGSYLPALVHNLRSAAFRRIDSLYESSPPPRAGYYRAMLRGLLLGESAGIRRMWIEDFRSTGTYHALVISGGHVAFLTGLFLLWLRSFRRGETGVLAVACGLAWFYALLAGAEAPVLRSAAGFTLFALGRFFYRAASLLNLLACVAIVFLLLDPSQLFEASFQLSFLAVTAIASLAATLIDRTTARWRPALRSLHDPRYDAQIPLPAAPFRVELKLAARTLNVVSGIPLRASLSLLSATARIGFFVFESFAVSAAVQLALSVPMMLYFHRLSWTGLSANLLVTPLITCAIPFGFLGVLTGWPLFGAAAAALIDASRSVASFHARFEPSLRVPDPPYWLLAAAVLSVVLLALAIRSRRGWLPFAALAFGLAAMAALYPFPAAPLPGLEVVALDVGMGDSIFLSLPDGSTMLVDAGGIPSRPGAVRSLDIGEDVVAPYLWSRGLRSLNVLVMTHPDVDHSGGIPALLQSFRPAELWHGPLPDTPRVRAILGQAHALGTRTRQLHRGDRLGFGSLQWSVLSPAPGAAPDGNRTSLVLHGAYRRHAILLTGDMERSAELAVLDAGILPRAQILKVAHHGSRTSSAPAFLDAVRPAVALLSAGRGNLHRLPHPDVVASLRSRVVMILRTDLSGAVGVFSDGRYLRPAAPATASRFSPWWSPDP